MDGIIVVNKPKDFTSRDVVNVVGKKLKTKKIGHTGTLDPIATGVLVLCVGKATKLVEVLTSDDKEYIAEVTLGYETDTLDNTGKILKEEEVLMKKEQILVALNQMIGEYDQEVPIYSAVKINGKKLYEYARNNEEIVLPKRKVNIKNIDLISDIKHENNKTIFKIQCKVSKGTYIRSLIRDLAYKLNTIGIMSDLKRISQGIFNISESYTLDQIKNDEFKIISLKDALNNFYFVNVDEKLEFKVKNGVILPNIYNKDFVVFTRNENVLAIYKAKENNFNLLEVFKMF